MNVTGARAETGCLGHRAGGWAEGVGLEFTSYTCIVVKGGGDSWEDRTEWTERGGGAHAL